MLHLRSLLQSLGRSSAALAVLLAMLLLTCPPGWADYPSENPAADVPGAGEPAKPAEAPAEDRPTATFQVDALSQYIWRGIALSKNSAVFQPSLTASWKGFSVNVWGNFDTYEKNPFSSSGRTRGRGAKWNETDFTAGYSRDIYTGDFIKAVTVNLGAIYYALDQDISPQGDSFELYTGLAVDVNWFKLAATANYEMFHYPGIWLNLGISRVFNLPFVPLEGTTLEVGNNILFLFSRDRGAYPNPSDTRLTTDPAKVSAFNGPLAGQLYATLNLPVHKYITIAPKVGFWYALGGKSTYLLGGGGPNDYSGLSWDYQHNHIYGGVSVVFTY